MSIEAGSRREDDDVQELLARIRAGDEAAARELAGRYEAEIRLVVRRRLPRLLRSRCDSIDFLQSVWGDFFHQIRTDPARFKDSRHLLTYLIRAARNKVVDEYRRACRLKQDARREESVWPDGRRTQDIAGDVDTPSEMAQAREEFDRLLGLLPEGRRAILEWKAAGLSSQEIGDRLGISARTVQRVLEDLRRRSGTEK
jgi:RNA polymerase sigma-70 factor (ECF subfamily)